MSTGFAPRNRIRAYSRWPEDRAERIAAAKTEISAATFFQRIGIRPPKDILKRSNAAASVLDAANVPIWQWE